MLIIPTYNEHDNIPVSVSRIRKAAGDEPILFVDDNSPDGTAEVIRRMQASDRNIHLLPRPPTRVRPKTENLSDSPLLRALT